MRPPLLCLNDFTSGDFMTMKDAFKYPFAASNAPNSQHGPLILPYSAAKRRHTRTLRQAQLTRRASVEGYSRER